MAATGGDDFNHDELADELRAAFGVEEGSDAEAMDLNLGAGMASSAAAGRLGDGESFPAGSRVADFRIVEELGRGGMGVVYRAVQLSLDREVALKVLPNRARQGRSAIQRFRSEARAAARLHHTNIVPVFAHGDDNGQFYYAMDLIEGGSLDQAIRHRTRLLSPSNRTLVDSVQTADLSTDDTVQLGQGTDERSKPASGSLELEQEIPAGIDVRALHRETSDFRHLASLIAEIADGLNHAHDHGVIHRDIKPQNLLIGADERLHITDFGLARLVDEPTLTVSGELMGTPLYLSPEQIDNSKGGVDHRTDIYSLGVTFYELLTLQRPITGETRDQILTGIRTQQPTPPRKIDKRIPLDLETICLKAMEKELKSRYATAGDMAIDLRRFAEGRPIRSRRIGPIGRSVKWAKRNKAASSAMLATCITLLMGAGWGLSATASRKDRANHLIAKAYDRVLFRDYKKTDGISETLDAAERLGGDEAKIALLRGLSGGCLQGKRAVCGDAIEQLEAIRDPDQIDAEVDYALACMYDRDWQERGARALIEAADDVEDRSASAWFLRGLAFHFDDQDEAIRSYERARELRAEDGEFFMQATLHLARAYNQRMYASRSIDDFDATRDALNALIDNNIYGGFPYLLSIAERLAGEIYRGSTGTRDDAAADEHFAASLAIARKGQDIDPDNPSPYSAEAFCLEIMGRYEEAIAAQTQVMAKSARGHDRWCEALHYRWRLNYWTGAFDEALDDIKANRGCKQFNRAFFYDHVYPMLIEAERGNMDRAVDHALAISRESPSDASAVIWTTTCLRLLGKSKLAQEHIEAALPGLSIKEGAQPSATEAFITDEWMEALLDLVRGTKTLDELLIVARETEQPWRLIGEAEFHAAVLDLASGDRRTALEGIKRAYRSFDRATRYTYHAEVLLRKMEMDPSWPPWMVVDGLDFNSADVVQP
ncbi:MAG: protein kinase [Planctomycetes bacterium]|nr:protein kinase [Planctomycetota bacterium]